LKIVKTHINDLIIIEPTINNDGRGYFFESFKENFFKENGIDCNFIQDNEAKSSYGVLRGLHFQNPPFDQSKLLRVIQGEILDVSVDLRSNSKSYGEVFAIKLNDVNKKTILVPKGFAHGYLVLSDVAIVAYKVDQKYTKEAERGIIWNDEFLNIDWIIDEKLIVLSEKDTCLEKFNEFKTPFL
jgi:dTDP-4-dehydrorhamnose 3,5-epimerase